MQHWIGSSGFSYKSWKGIFYPPEVKEAAFLSYYSRKLPSVELNNTFYRMPSAQAITRWVQEVPDTFRFAVKAPQRLTHQLRLKDSAEASSEFVTALAAFGSLLGPVLFQLPPNMKADRERLARFLDNWPRALPCAFEFRHVSWLDDSVFDLLREHEVALCSADGEAVDTPIMATARHGYVRLRRETYTEAELQIFSDRLRAQPWQSVHVYFKHEATAPEYAHTLLRLLAA
jgi:uncharacterized protein YecE (DUF72 family)